MYSNLIFFKRKTMVCMLFALLAIQATWASGTKNVFPKVSINVVDASLVTIFSNLSEQSDYKFSYGESIITDHSQYSVSEQKKQLNEVLDGLSQQANISYTVQGELVFVKKMQQQEKIVATGKVVDENNEPLPGVNVIEVGTTNGVITDVDGNFSLELSGVSTKVAFSFIGYESVEVEAGADMKIKLEPTSESLKEVMVVGYGRQQRADVTGAIDGVKAESFNNGVMTNPEQLFQGKVSGVRIVNSSGEPGAGVDVMIRGVGSIRSGNSPLFVVDGMPLSNDAVSPDGISEGLGSARAKNPLNFLNPNDIESINILKDASAAAIYGARGSNGVIIITTKKGKTQRPQFTIDSYVGFSKVANKLDLLSGDDYAEENPEHANTPNANTDWQDELMRTALTKSNNLSFSNATDQGNYYASLSHIDQEGIIEESNFERYSGRLNMTQSFLDDKRLTVTTNLTASHTKDIGIPTSDNAGATGELITHMLKANPTLPVYKEDGELNDFDNDGSYNPLYLLDMHDDLTRTLRVLGNIETKFRIINGFDYKFNFGIDKSVSERNTTFFANTTEIQKVGAHFKQNLDNYNYLLEHYLTFNRLFNNHKVTVLAGFSYQKYYKSGTTYGAYGIERGVVKPIYNPGFATNMSKDGKPKIFTPIGFTQENELQSFFNRLNYSYKGKYLFTASMRIDGSTRFGENNKYGYFPSFALGWNIAEESFMSGLDQIDELKIRTSWGKTGNQEVPNKVTQATFEESPKDGYYLNGESSNLTSGITYKRAANPDLKWEVVSQMNLGMDFRLLKGKIYGSIDYFKKVTSDAIQELPSIHPNFSKIWANMDGEIVNKGIEFSLGSDIIKGKDFSWTIDFNGATLDNEVKGIPLTDIKTGSVSGSGLSATNINIYKNGYAAGSFYLKRHLGFDENGKSILTEEREIIESALPKFTYGLSSSLRFKNIDLSFSFTGQSGAYLFNNTKLETSHALNLLSAQNISYSVLNSKQSRLDQKIPSDYYLEKSDYLRLNNIRLGYTFRPQGISWLSELNIYATGQNLFTITDYSGYDPAVNTSKNVSGNSSIGMDYASYPSAKTYLFGVKFKY